ncbi:V-set and transmembrane domain-containing protein 1-like isoform X2 [Notamacropus eugenii]|uniref:V-set and transmembrane domain-containing protein 1-like isoform X2 n=1 Tax=Notamacropus eugenii TaxID=9315 RepID=UPI003B680812
MTHTLSVLLCLGLCLGERMKAQADTLPRPSLKVESSSLVLRGRNVTLRCQGSVEADDYRLEKAQGLTGPKIMDVKPSGIEGEFHIPSVTEEDAGTYVCLYRHSSVWSERSDPLELVVTVTLSPSPDSEKMPFGPAIGISVGASAFLTLLFLFLILLFCHRRRWHQARLRNGSKEAETKKMTRSSDPEEGTHLEETLYAAVDDDRQTEKTRQEDTAAPKREDPQEVTYAKLNLNSLKAGAKDPPPSGAVEPSLYAAIQGAQPEPRGPLDKKASPQ